MYSHMDVLHKHKKLDERRGRIESDEYKYKDYNHTEELAFL